MSAAHAVGLIKNIMVHKAIVKTGKAAYIAGVKPEKIEGCKQKYADKVKDNLVKATRPLQKGYIKGYGQHKNDNFKGYFIGYLLRPLDSVTDDLVNEDDKDRFLTEGISSLVRIVGEEKAWGTVSKNVDNSIEHKMSDKTIMGITIKEATVQKIARAIKPIIFPIIKSIINEYVVYNPSCRNPEMDSFVQLATRRMDDAAITRMGMEIDRRGEAAQAAWKAVSIKDNVDPEESLELPEKPAKGDVIQKVAVVHARAIQDREANAYQPNIKERVTNVQIEGKEGKIKKLEKKLAQQRVEGNAKAAKKIESKLNNLKESVDASKQKHAKKMQERVVTQHQKAKESAVEKEEARFQELEAQIDASDISEDEKIELKNVLEEGKTINMLPFHPDAHQLGIKHESIEVDVVQSITTTKGMDGEEETKAKEKVTLMGRDGKIFDESQVEFTPAELKAMGSISTRETLSNAEGAMRQVDDLMGIQFLDEAPDLTSTSHNLYVELSRDTFSFEIKADQGGFMERCWNWGASWFNTSVDPTEAQYSDEVQLLQNACRKNPEVYRRVVGFIAENMVQGATLKPAQDRMVEVSGLGLCAKALNAQGDTIYLKVKTDEDNKPVIPKSIVHIEDHASDKSQIFLNITYSTAFETEGYYTSLDSDAHLFKLAEDSDFQCSMTFNLMAQKGDFSDLSVNENSRPEKLDFRVVTVRELSGERDI